MFTVRVFTMRTGAPGLFVARSHRTCAARPCASSFLPDEGGNPMVIRRSSSALVISAHHQRSSSALFMLTSKQADEFLDWTQSEVIRGHQRSSALFMLTSKQADKFLRNLGLIVRVLIREPREGRDGMHVRLLRPVIEQLHERRDRAVVSTGMQGRSSVAINMPARAVRSPPPWRSSLG